MATDMQGGRIHWIIAGREGGPLHLHCGCQTNRMTVSVNTGTTHTFYSQQYCSCTKPLGTTIWTALSFMSTNIKLSVDWRSYLSLPATFLGTDWHSSSATVMWSCLSFGTVDDTSDINDINDTNDTPVTVQLTRTSGHRPTARSRSGCQVTPDNSTVSC